MIFVTVGTQKFQFNRLLKKIDDLIDEGVILPEYVFAQAGYSTYTPRNYAHQKFLTKEELNARINASELVITHGGTGSIINSLKLQKRVIAVPRDSSFGEHVDNHQYEIVEQFRNSSMIIGISDIKKLGTAILESENSTFKKFHSNSEKFNGTIQRYINEWVK